MSVYELTAKELFAWYTNGENAAEILSQGRAEIAARLQKEERLAEKDAFYAADRILAHAQALESGTAPPAPPNQADDREQG